MDIDRQNGWVAVREFGAPSGLAVLLVGLVYVSYALCWLVAAFDAVEDGRWRRPAGPQGEASSA